MAYRLAAAELNTPGGTNGEKADFIGNGGDGAGTDIECIVSSPDNIASIAWTTSPRYFCNNVSTSLLRRDGNTLHHITKYEIIHLVDALKGLFIDRFTYRNKTSIGDRCDGIVPMKWAAWW